MRNLVQGTISDMLTSVSHHRQPVLMVKGNLDCERPPEGAVDEGHRKEGHQPTIQNLLLLLASHGYA